MSYNIDNWKTKKLDNLVIPLKALYKHKRKDLHPEQPVITNEETNEVTIECGCEQEIKGTITEGLLTVTEFDMTGEGSGTFYEYILKPALEESTGVLEAVLIWEGGDTIQRLVVKNGEILETNIEL
jgi:hypothetical protein